jgi:hypothetical protein
VILAGGRAESLKTFALREAIPFRRCSRGSPLD